MAERFDYGLLNDARGTYLRLDMMVEMQVMRFVPACLIMPGTSLHLDSIVGL
jgi:hypothetical protein